MNDKLLRSIAKETFENWNGTGSWAKASNWRKSDWRKLVESIVTMAEAGEEKIILPSQRPLPPQPFRPYRADAADDNPED